MALAWIAQGITNRIKKKYVVDSYGEGNKLEGPFSGLNRRELESPKNMKLYLISFLFASSPSYPSKYPRRNLHSSIINRSMKPSVLHRKGYIPFSSRT